MGFSMVVMVVGTMEYSRMGFDTQDSNRGWLAVAATTAGFQCILFVCCGETGCAALCSAVQNNNGSHLEFIQLTMLLTYVG